MPNHNDTIGGGGFHHVAIRARDFDKSVTFYTQALGLTEKMAWGKAPGRAVMLDTGDGNYLEIFERPDQPAPAEQPQPAILHFALRTDDVDSALERARAHGAPVTMEPRDVDLDSSLGDVTLRIAFFQGPDGEIIELFKNGVC